MGQEFQNILYNDKFERLNNELRELHRRNAELAARIAQLEKFIHFPNSVGQDVAMKEAAVRAEIGYSAKDLKGLPASASIRPEDTVTMRSDVETILTLRAFVESIATKGSMSYYVPYHVNQLADEALGRKK